MNSADWDSIIGSLPGVTFLQTSQWAEIKLPNGWVSDKKTWVAQDKSVFAAAMVLTRSLLKLPVSVAYVPRGPLVDWRNSDQYQQVLSELIVIARSKKAIYLKIDPDLTVGRGIPNTETDQPDQIGLSVQEYLQNSGWMFSQDQIQFRNTVEIDLQSSEESILARMHQKTRYNIRLAERKGVRVSEAAKTDWDLIYRMYAETATRDEFVIRGWDYYERVWNTLTQGSMATCLKAEIEGDLVAAIWVVGFGRKAHYLYGMSSSLHRDCMPNHLLQWRGMQLAKSQGRAVYDMWGAPNEFSSEEPLSGVFRFKHGFGGEVIRTIGAMDYPIRPNLYHLYTVILPRLLDIMRKRSRKQTRQVLAT
ncbi:MAG: peptidoglycan bridge formation glycyltransferase FemA/FemB family protein [Leptolinea sp.]